MTNLSPNDVAELRELLAKASPGPWANSGATFDTESGPKMYGGCHFDEISISQAVSNCKLIAALHNAAPALLALASQSLEREVSPDYTAAIAKELLERGCAPTKPGWNPGTFVHAPTDQVVRAVLAVGALTTFRPLEEYQAEREAEVRLMAIEECAKVADRSVISDEEYAVKHPDEEYQMAHRAHRGRTIAAALRALAEAQD